MGKRAKNRRHAAPSKPGGAPVSSGPPNKRLLSDEAKIILKAWLIVGLGIAIYWPALTGGWLWDDRDLIADNALVHDPNGLWKIWFEPGKLFDFFPLEVSVVWFEWRLFGEDTLGYHLVSLALHLTSAFLLWRLLRKFGLRHAWLGGLIFTVHPVMVESVAWISELKNTLSLPLFLLVMSVWIDYDARRKTGDYILALVLFLLAMLTKSTMVMFPLVILLFAWWKRSRINRRDWLASAPFFAISLLIGIAVVWFLGRTEGEKIVVLGGVMSRLACAGLSIAFYFSKSVLPLDLVSIYPKWIVDPPSPEQFLPWPVLGGVLYFLWTKRASWGRHALLGLGFFLINLLPFLGFTAGSYMYMTWVMDHILYLPIIGLIGLFVAAVGHVEAQLSRMARWIGATIIAAAVMWMTLASEGYAALYSNLITMWEYNVARVPESPVPHYDLGAAYSRVGRNEEAMAQFRTAIKLNPDYFYAHYSLGILLFQNGDAAEALPHFQAAVRIWPHRAESHHSYGAALHMVGRIDEAIEQYHEVLAIDPHFMVTYHNLAICLANQHRLNEALQVVQTGLQVDPTDSTLQNDAAQIRELQQKQAGGKGTAQH